MLGKLTLAHQAILDVPKAHAVGSPAFNLFMENRGVDYTYDVPMGWFFLDCGFKVTIKASGEATLDYSQGSTPTKEEAATIGHLTTSIAAKLKAHGDFYVNT